MLRQCDFFKQLLVRNELIFVLYLEKIYTKYTQNTRRNNDLLSAYQKAYFDVTEDVLIIGWAGNFLDI